MKRWASVLLNLGGAVAAWVLAAMLVLVFNAFPYWNGQPEAFMPFQAVPSSVLPGLLIAVIFVIAWGAAWLGLARRRRLSKSGHQAMPVWQDPLAVSLAIFVLTASVSTWLIAKDFTFM